MKTGLYRTNGAQNADDGGRKRGRTEKLKEQGEMFIRTAAAVLSRAIGVVISCTLAISLSGLSAKAAPAEQDADHFRILASEIAVDLDRLAMDRARHALPARQSRPPAAR